MEQKETEPRISVNYGQYLNIHSLLQLQNPRSTMLGQPAHDETLFIIVHQVHELWFKQILHELNSLIEILGNKVIVENQLRLAVSRLHRITVVQKGLIENLRVLETMTPLDFLEFRSLLTPASGFQSIQFRLLEITLGLHSEVRLNGTFETFTSSVTDESDKVTLQKALQSPSLFQLIESWLERTPFLEFAGYSFWQDYRKAVDERLNKDRLEIEKEGASNPELLERQLAELRRTQLNYDALFDPELHQDLCKKGLRRLSLKATHAALFINLYRDFPILHLPFQILTLLVDMDELMQTWRSQHASVVHRMIGTKVGTGSSAGYSYLQQTIGKYKIFTDLFNLSTFLIPRSALPDLPENLKKNLDFNFSAGKLPL